MCDSVPSARYSPVCNVLRQWKTSLIPTYRVYQLYDKKIKLTKMNGIGVGSCAAALEEGGGRK